MLNDSGEEVEWDSERISAARRKGALGAKTGIGKFIGKGKGKGAGNGHWDGDGSESFGDLGAEPKRISLAARYLSAAPNRADKFVKQVQAR